MESRSNLPTIESQDPTKVDVPTVVDLFTADDLYTNRPEPDNMPDPVPDLTNSSPSNTGEGGSTSATDSDRPTIEAYAKLMFVDCDYYMTTYAVEFGRAMPTSPDEISPQVEAPLESIDDVREASATKTLDDRPSDCPLLHIYPPEWPPAKKSVSRRHVRIQFNHQRGIWEILFLGRNGGFLNGEFWNRDSIRTLRSHSVIQIGHAGFEFVIPNVPEMCTGAERYGIEVESDNGSETGADDDSIGVMEEVEDESGPAPRGRIRSGGKSKHNRDTEQKKPKRKGPGRPPKNGVMSKREEAQLAKQAKEEAEKRPKQSNKVNGRGRGMTRKAMELEKSSTQPNGKRKYTKRNKTEENEKQNRGDSTEKTDSATPEQIPAKQLKMKRPKPARSPSPVYDKDKLTPEQLAKPPHSYVILIHEALSNSKVGLTLPQIYRAIERKYPYFKVTVTTAGWQSSVRHNLNQHIAFRKIEKEGKGWVWGINPEVSIEKARKLRATPPPSSQARLYPPSQPQQPRPGTFTYPVQPPGSQISPNGGPPINGYAPGNAYNMPPRMQHGTYSTGPTPNVPGYPVMLKPTEYQSPYDQSSRPQGQQDGGPHQSTDNSREQHGQPGPPGVHDQHLNHSMQNSLPIHLHHQPQASVRVTPPRPKWDGHDVQGKSFTVSNAFRRFKHSLLNDDMQDRAHSENLIDSAINRTLDPSVPSTMTKETDLNNEKTLMASLNTILSDLGDQDEPVPADKPQQGQNENVKFIQVVDDAVKKLPRPRAFKAQNHVDHLNGTNFTGSENGLKHKRTDTADEFEKPNGKKRSS